MRTFGELQTYIQNIFNDTSTPTQNLLRIVAGDVYSTVKRELNLAYEVKQTTITSLASTATYDLPVDYNELVDVKITVGGVDYFPKMIANRDQWNDLTSGISTTATSDYPSYARINPESTKFQIQFYPTLSSAGNTITVNYFAMSRDLVANDFTDKSAGTVSITTATKTIVGAGTAFAVTDVGRYIRFDTNGFWYRIATYTDATHITLERNFEGATIAGGAYLLGTLPSLPGEAMDVIAKFTLQALWEKREDATVSGGKATYYETRAQAAMKKLKKQMEELYDSPDVSVIDRSRLPLNPNDYPLNIGT